MLENLQKILEERCQLNRAQPVIVGVSGGADSLTLLNILREMAYPVMAAHFNHHLRPESSDDARTVEGIAAKLNVPFILGEGNTPDHAQEHKLSIEEAARELRYRFLFEQAEKHAAQAVAVAHNADDQVETVLMHLLRGAGLDGLTGMDYRSLPNPWSATIPLVRPLLDIWRAEIDTFCAENNLTPVVDVTNTDTTYFRNRLRHELIPELETYVPGFRTRLHQTADLLTADRRTLDSLTAKIWQETIHKIEGDYIILQSSIFNLHSLALRRRLIRKAVSYLRPGARDVDYALVQRALDFAENPTVTAQTDLGLGLQISIEGDQLIIADWHTELPTDHWPQIIDQCSLSVPGKRDLGNGWFLRTEILSDVESAKRAAPENRDPYQAWVDLGALQSPLTVRPRRPGDRFQPLGMRGKSMKISDFMINQKIPQRARAGWPLVCCSAEVIWVPGYRLAHPCRVSEKSQQIVLVTLKQWDSP